MGRRSTPDDATRGDARRRARALTAPTRRRLVDLLLEAAEPLTAQVLAAELGVHHTAVRQHMLVLVDAGLVVAEPLPPTGRGRPRMGYRAVGEPDPYRWLSGALAAGLDQGITPIELGRRLGADEARSSDPAAALMGVARRLGFEPRLRRDGAMIDIVLAECPFAEVAMSAPHVVCELHRGIAEGIAVGVDGVESVELRVAPPTRGGCRITARRVG